MMVEVKSKEVTQVLLFGDQTVDKLPAIKSLVNHSGNSVLLNRFLRQACDIVQIEVSRLRPHERTNISNFDSLLALAEDNAQQQDPNEIVATILMGVARIGELIWHAERDSSILGSSQNATHILGLCTGEIVAAIPAASESLPELYSLSVEVVGIFCRFARDVIRRSVLVDSTNDSWATTFVGIPISTVQTILDEFHLSEKIPSLNQVAVGFVAQGWVTLFGPPTTTQKLLNWSKVLNEAPRVPSDARGGVHMPHMPELDEIEIVGPSPLFDKTLPPTAIVWSPYNCQQRQGGTLRQLLSEIIRDVTQKPLLLKDTIAALGDHLSSHASVNITAAGYTPHLPVIHRSFLSRGITCTITEDGQNNNQTPQNLRGGTGRFAIVGMSGRFPGSESVADYWQSLLDAERFVREIPNERFNLDKWFDPTGKQKNATVNRSGAFLDRPGAFDHRLFNMSPREAFQADPLHRLFLTVCYEALETSGYSPNATPSSQSNRIATYFGQTSDDWRDLLLTKGVDIYYAPGICRAFGPSRVNYHFKWGGPSYGIDSACASSVTAISLACASLTSRECDMALAGGGSILNSPAPFAGLSRGGFLSPEKGCETYHDEADGYVRGEGVGVVVLKRLEDAIAENDNILGVIAGAARNYSSDASSISHPSPDAQQRLYRQVLHQSGTDPSSVGYVEMHGTGTQAGDAAEMSSVLRTFAGGRSRDNPLVVGAVKANIGHGEAAAGVCALIKAVMMFRDGKIPPQPGMPFQINRGFPDLARMNVYIAGNDMFLGPSADRDGKRRIFLNSFDASGGNSCLLLEEPPKVAPKHQDPRPHHIVTLSARTPKSIRDIMVRYHEYIQKNPGISLADLAYSSTARRMHSTLRVSFVATSLRELSAKLEAAIATNESNPPRKAGTNSVVFAFTGQGSQYAGMGRQLWKHSQEFRRLIESYQAISLALELPQFIDLISQDTIDLTSVSAVSIQLSIVAVEIAIAKLWISWGVQPSMVIGHSLGEYAALCVAGVLTVSDALALVGRRAQMLVESIPQNQAAMLAISKSAEETKRILTSTSTRCEIACLNTPQSTVVSGSLDDLEKLQEDLRDQGTRATLLRVPFAFHSSQLEPILDSFESTANGVSYSAPSIPVASTLLGRVVHPGELGVFSPLYLRRQAREPVNFIGALQASQEATIVRPGTIFLEVGPEPVCLGLVRGNLASSVKDLQLLPSLRSGENNWATLSNSLSALYQAGLSINWTEYHHNFVQCLSLCDLPTYCFDEKDFWEPYPDPDTAINSLPESKPEAAPSMEGFPTTSLQRIEREKIDQDKISVCFQSHTAEPHLLSAIQAHAVAGIKICSSSVFSDMALSAAHYARERLQPGSSDAIITIRSLDIRHAVVVMDINPSQIIEVEAEYIKGTTSAQVYFRTKTDESPLEDIGICEIEYSQNSADLPWKNDLSRRKLLIDSRIEALHAADESGKGHRMLRPVIYQLFSGLVEYGKGFQGLDELVMDDKFRDAVGKVQLPALENEGNFLYSPYLLDAIVHLVGFLANCGLKYPSDIAFLSTGFDTWHLLTPLSANALYTSYAYLEESTDGVLLVGDVYVMEGTELVSVLSGIRFQKMKKTVLSRILLSAAPASGRKNTRFAPQTDADDGLLSGMTTGPSTSRVTSPPTSGVSTPGTSVDESPVLVETFLKVVSEEAGVEISELQPDMSFVDLGVDSLMTITVIAALRNETGLELSGSFFLDNATVGEATKALGANERGGTPEEEDIQLDAQAIMPTEVPEQRVSETEPATLVPAKALLLQGSASISEVLPLFALPDGTGSVSAYVQLPPLGESRRMYGLESPFVRQESASLAQLSFESLVDSFVRAIREIQPEGPYMLIGCSTGATFAFEVARILLEAGQTVQELVLGGPAPVPASDKLQNLSVDVEQVDQSGLLGGGMRGGSQALQQKSHLAASLQALTKYQPQRMPAGRSPSRTTIIMPTKGLHSKVSDASIKASEFLSWVNTNWSNPEKIGWVDLLSESEVLELESDYLSMMRYPQVETVGEMINNTVTRS